ncbi:Serine/threonine-protein kinase, active site, partial [Sesbania bispinosa]
MSFIGGAGILLSFTRLWLADQVSTSPWSSFAVVSSSTSRNVYHRDLKPENLLLDEDGNLKAKEVDAVRGKQVKTSAGR